MFIKIKFTIDTHTKDIYTNRHRFFANRWRWGGSGLERNACAAHDANFWSEWGVAMRVPNTQVDLDLSHPIGLEDTHTQLWLEKNSFIVQIGRT